MKTTTMQHLGHAAGRARRVAPPSWRPAAAFGAALRGTTGVDVSPLPVSFHETPGNTNDTTQPAVATVCMTATPDMTIKRSARHLGSRST